MKVSVVVSTRNRNKLLMERSLPSVFEQTRKDFELIVIDDHGERAYWEDGYSLHGARYHRNMVRRGLAHNRNLGANMALGDYVISLDDDNKFHPRLIEKAVAVLDANPDIDGVGVGKNVVYPEGATYQLQKLPCSINDGFLIRKSVFDKIRFDESLHANEDADFGIQFFRAGFKMAMIDEPLMTVYGSPIINTTSYSDYTDYHLDGLAKFWLKNHEYKEYLGRMFMLASGKKWFRWLYILEQKLKRYYQICRYPARRLE